MNKKKFKYGWFEKRRFSAERKCQVTSGVARYVASIDSEIESYWLKTEELPPVDKAQQDVLTTFCRNLIG